MKPSGMWSDYVFRLCSRCGFKSYCVRGDTVCRDCHIKATGR